MSRLSRLRGRWTIPALIVVLALVAGGVYFTRSGDDPVAVPYKEANIDAPESPDSTQTVTIETRLYLPQQTPAPAIMLAHGFGGSLRSVHTQAEEFARRGFVVLTWSARGFGRSTGQIALNSLDREVRDAQKLLDFLGTRDEVQKDTGGDPRVGVTGASYGGALSLLLAGVDKRVDTLVPVITYNDLAQALLPNSSSATQRPDVTPAATAFGEDGVFKRSWAGIFFSAGMTSIDLSSPTGEAPEMGQTESNQPATQQQPGGNSGAAGQPPTPSLGACGRFTPEVCAAYTEVATTGRASQQTLELLRRSSPVAVTDQIKQPAMLVQGEQDTLFGLDQSDATARQITAAGGKVKMVWYAGGHDGGNPGTALRGEIADWMAFHLQGKGTDPGTGFEYTVQGAFRSSGTPSLRTVVAPSYPGLSGAATERRTVKLSGREQVAVNPAGGNPAAISNLPGLGSALARSSSISSRLSIDLPGQAAVFTSDALDSQLLLTGSSTVRLRVARGDQSSGEAILFAKLYDVSGDGTRVLPGSAVAPFRVALPPDGSAAEVTVTLPPAVRPVESEHKLALVVSTTDQAFANAEQPAAYRISLASDELSVPVVPGRNVTTGFPTSALWGILITLLVLIGAGVIAMFRRRLAHDSDPSLSDVPLVISNLTKSYPGGLTAVKDLSFRVEHGQVLGLLGPNGAGKTTTLRMVMGLIHPSEGNIRVFGHKVTPGAPVLSRIGSFVEGSGFLPHLSGAANLRLYWAATGRPLEEAHIEEALEIAGLGDAVHRRVRTYSQGMRQRLAIAQAMLGLPDLLILDEPTNGLDPPQIHQMREVLRRYAAAGRTVLVSSHLLAEVEQTCSHVVVMHKGQLVAAGEVADIAAGGGEATFRVDSPSKAADVLRGLEGVHDVHEDEGAVHASMNGVPRAAALSALVAAGVAVDQAGPRRRLEDAFLELVGE
ncbi:ABC-2 type transport system ATP-binding protein [Lentzea atacamensis]|uniref:ABC-2 type transport system ATP-binding protein n=1 Tax=Lentzea atacamensis TaxID=531938 RepID=A0A316HPA5_9PSEU|nr:alpha/beta fold hydrolase [Lentzea atacamensis]PWK82014.1 ABC-2 type transport system ATP-binding protein [Lentzea atacamensis]RAS61164.1 ABC-2 type transport system ATP-binding protein [Lentzea atacamensis]